MEVPVSGIDFGFVGFTTTTATALNSGDDRITVTSSANFDINDGVVFTGDIFSTEITLGQTYYIFDKPTATTVRLTDNPGGSLINFSSTATGSMTMAKAGSFAFLPEPFYFSPSIVRYLGRVWVCVISNNDDEFILGKWEELTSGDRRLNALDRVIGYYQPTVNMPGVDLTQLFEGIIYPYPIYQGNAFEPDQQYPLDVILQDQPFYPTEVDLTSVVYDGEKYIAPANLPNYSAVVGSLDSENWAIGKLTNAGIGITDIIYGGNYYVMTSTNSATPILRSNNGIEWTTNGYYTPYSFLPYDANPYDMTALSVSALALNSVGFSYQTSSTTVNATNLIYGQRYAIRTVGTTNFTTVGASSNTVGTTFTATGTATGTGTVFLVDSVYIAVGENIIRSEDTYIWRQTTDFNPVYNYQLFGVSGINIPNFSGFVAVGKGKMLDYSTGVTELIDTNLLFYSSNSGLNWNQVPSLTPNGLNSVTSNGTVAVAVGESGAIYYSENGVNWFGVTEASVSSVNTATNQIGINSTAGLNVNETIKFTKSFGSVVAGTTYYVNSIDSASVIKISATSGGAVKQLVNITAGSFVVGTSYVITSLGTTNFTLIGAASNTVGITFTATGAGSGDGTANIVAGGNIPVQTIMYQYDPLDPNPSELRDVIYANGVWIAVGDDGTVKTSSDYLTWTLRNSGTTNSLKGITFNADTTTFTVVGDNNTIITSDDNGVTWASESLLSVTPPLYDVQGSPFEYGYGPEELVPGLISDDLAMIVTTKPGSTWPIVEYGHSGFNVVSIVLTPTTELQTQYSFKNVVQYPTQITVQVVNGVTGLAQSLSESQYTIDWVNKVITLDTPLNFLPVDSLRIEIYEAGGGNQLVKSNTDVNPIRENSSTGFDEIDLNCNYTAPTYEGGGAIRPGTEPITVLATETFNSSNRILCDSVDLFELNGPVTFQGVTFGNIQEDFTYYIKTISTATNTITVSASYNPTTGFAGPVFDLIDGTGTMYVNIRTGSGLVWSDPLVYHNGTRLVLGETGLITKSSPITNAFTTTTTAGLVTNEKIMFGQEMFGSGVTPLTTYYVRQVLDNNEFTISATLGGPVFPLNSASGTAVFISNDFAIGLKPNVNQAKLMFASSSYENGQDYLVYSIIGEEVPTTYGYSTPQVQEFVGNGSTTVFALTNFAGGDNPQNAVVEINGLRLLSSFYTINANLNSLLLNITPAAGDIVRVTTFNDTSQQYLTTQFGITSNPGNTLVTLQVGSTSRDIINYDDPEAFVPVSTNAGSFVPGDSYIITSLGNTNWNTVAGTTGYTWAVGDAFIAEAAGSGTGTADTQPSDYDGSGPIPSVTYAANQLVVNNNYEIISLGTTTDWNDVAGTTGYTYAAGDIITVVNTGSGDGTAASVNSAFGEDLSYLTLSSGTTSQLTAGDSVVFTANPDMLSGLIEGKTYYIAEVWSNTTFTISEVPGGPALTLTNDSGTMDINANPFVVVPITNINTTITSPLAQTIATTTTTSSNEINVLSTDNFVVGQTISFRGNPADWTGSPVFGGIIPGQIYFVDTIVDSTTVIIKDQDGVQVPLSNGSGTLVTTVGGNPTATVTTATAPGFALNTRIRLDGTSGSTQLNGNAYYVRPVTDTMFELYSQPYQTGLNDINYPVTTVSTYTGGGYIWQQGVLYIVTTYATATVDFSNRILVASTDDLIENTPVYFSKAGEENNTQILSNIEQGVEYYIKDITSGVGFTVSETQYGDEFNITSSVTGEYVNVTQWNQTNVDRVWATLNGYRIPSSKLRMNDFNELSILTTIVSGDELIITSMIPTAMPDEEVYINFVSTTNEGSVYREDAGSRTWLSQPLYDLSTTVYLADVTSVTNQIIQNVTTPAVIDGRYTIGLTAPRNEILSVQIVNNTTGSTIASGNYSIVIEDLAPLVKIVANVDYINVGDSLTITTLTGGTILVNGEQINFGSVDLANNTLGNIQRGANGTAKQFLIPEFANVYGLLDSNRLRDVYYTQVWNPIPGFYNVTEGDPLQIADTVPALFLRSDTDE